MSDLKDEEIDNFTFNIVTKKKKWLISDAKLIDLQKMIPGGKRANTQD